MKQVSTELREYLHSRKHFYACDIYELRLASGLVFRYADYDMDIITDGNTFSCKGPIFEREDISLSSGISVDKMNISVYVDATDTIGGTPTMHVANNGGFDDATLSLYRCYMSNPGVVVGTVEKFTGDINVKSGGGLEMNWEVKSSVQRLNVEWPLRKYYPTCPYALYGAGCGLNIDNYTAYGTVTAVNSFQSFNTNLAFPDNYYDQGGIEWLSGPLTGVSVPIKWSENRSGSLYILIPLESAPVVGNTFRVYPGCDKLPGTCNSKFNNYLRNRATPYIPLKETIV
jgi:uncharacterized phage protein (TIGR02218 family)